MSLEGRADRLYEGLTARERAILELESAKDDRAPDPVIRLLMPEHQVAEFNGYMAQLRGASRGVGTYVLVLEQELAHAQSQLLLLSVLVLWGQDRSVLLDYIAHQTTQPCTPEEYGAHLAEARAEELPLDVAVDAVIEARGTWENVPGEAPGAEAQRYGDLAGPIERELQALVRSKALAGRGRGAMLTLNSSAFYDWLGVPVSVGPEWGRGYEVLGAEEVGWRGEVRTAVRERVPAGPHAPFHVLTALAPSPAWLLPKDALTEYDRLLLAVAACLRADLRRLSGSLGAVEAVLDEVRAVLDGHDPVHPISRVTIERMRAELDAIAPRAATFLGTLDLPVRSAEELEQLRALLR